MSVLATDYSMAPAVARELTAVSMMPLEHRRAVLAAWAVELTAEEILEAFAQFIGLANSVVENGREMIEVILIVEGGMHPHSAEKANLPTIQGALGGVGLAAGMDEAKLCVGCAYRLGTAANQSPITTLDAAFCADPGEDLFLCHEELDADNAPFKACGGFAQLRASRKRVGT